HTTVLMIGSTPPMNLIRGSGEQYYSVPVLLCRQRRRTDNHHYPTVIVLGGDWQYANYTNS
ncbi:MAG TPA: hypothetical protein VKP88_06800, partial [Candidatus Paceibacterota bacterium]|nr:hypothetical protein [Candidatus Paceibacterota bacterium]